MTSERFNEHDGNQGAQSQGEFLGMTGNSAWYLLGSAGAAVMLVIVLWGMLGCSLVVCLGPGVTCCALSLGYVFALKNNRHAHYDTDFFESALIESGVLALRFGPNGKRPSNPFRSAGIEMGASTEKQKAGAVATRGARQAAVGGPSTAAHARQAVERPTQTQQRREADEKPTVPLAAYERLRDDLNAAEDALEDALSAGEEEGVCV